MAARRFLAIPLFLLLAACTSAGSSQSAGAATPSAQASASMAASEEPASVEPSAAAVTIGTSETDLGTILVDAEGNTIYYFANDEEGVSNCTGDCLANWPPVVAEGTPEAGDGVTAELGTIARADGSLHLTVNGFPAYYFAGDTAPGDTTGQGVGEIWWVFGADGEPIEN